MITGKTQNGFEFSISENALNNMELLDALEETIDDDNPNPLAVSKVLKMMLGNEQRKALYDFCRAEDGTVPITEVMAEFTAIMIASKDVKKS